MSTAAQPAGGAESITQYIPAAQVHKRYAVSRATLRRWAQDGRIRAVRSTGGGKRLYAVADLDELYQSTAIADTNPKAKVIYARVSSIKQRGDLDRQIQDLQSKCAGYALIQDVGSGLNWQRKGFQALLERVHKRDVEEVVVSHRDRLCRFGFELVEWIFQKAGVKLVVLSERDRAPLHSANDPDGTLAQELAEDLLSIVTVFVAKNNGRRAAENRKRRRTQEQAEPGKERRVGSKESKSQEEAKGDTCSQSQEDSSLSG